MSATSPSTAIARRPGFTLGFGLALASAALFSGKAIVVKLAYRYQVDAVTLLALRMVLSLPLFALAALWSARRQRGNGSPLSRGDWLRIGFLGFTGYYLASFLDFLGLQYISAALERLILFLYPTVVMLITARMLGRAVSRTQWLALAVSYVGIAVVFVHDLLSVGQVSADRSAIVIGAGFVFGSAISYALYLVSSGELVKRIGSIRLTSYATVIACMLCIAQFAATRDLSVLAALAPQVWALSVFNAVFCTVVPVFGTMLAISRIGAPNVSLTGMLGPVATMAFGAMMLGEPVTWWQSTGAALVLTGVFLVTRSR